MMNRDQVKGRAKEAGGKAKEVAGRVTGNRTMEGKGIAKKTLGKIQKSLGDSAERSRERRKPS
jgi:uncharacterized protein YjbJ (UPF0337 family)